MSTKIIVHKTTNTCQAVYNMKFFWIQWKLNHLKYKVGRYRLNPDELFKALEELADTQDVFHAILEADVCSEEKDQLFLNFNRECYAYMNKPAKK